MAGAGWRTFTAGQVLTSTQVQTYLQDQVVQVYANTAARSSALGTLVSSGMVSFGTTLGNLDLYNNGVWSGLNYSTITNATATTYTIGAADANTTVNFSNASAITVTVPDVLEIGERVDVIRDGAGAVTFAAGTGVTTWAGAGTAGTALTFSVAQRYGAATLMKVAANSYRVVGNIA